MIRYFLKDGWERLFYFLSAYILMLQIDMVRWQALMVGRADWMFPFNFIPLTSGTVYLLLFYTCCAGFLLFALLPKRFPPLALVLWIVAVALINSFGKVSNSCDGFVLATLGMSIGWIIARSDSGVRLGYALVASTYIYAAAGLWKLRRLLEVPDFFQGAEMTLPYNIAYGLGEFYRDDGRMFLDFFVRHPTFSALTWIAILTIQICLPLGIIFFKKWRFLFCLLLIFFHLSTYWVVGVSFWPQIYLLILFGAESFYRQFSYPRMTSAGLGR